MYCLNEGAKTRVHTSKGAIAKWKIGEDEVVTPRILSVLTFGIRVCLEPYNELSYYRAQESSLHTRRRRAM